MEVRGEAVTKDIVRLWDETQIGRETLLSILKKAREKMLNLQEKIVSEGDDDDWDDEDNENVEGDGEKAPRLVEREVSKQVTK